MAKKPRKSVPTYEEVQESVRSGPRYNSRTDSWNGRGANLLNGRLWGQIKNRAEDNINEGAVYHLSALDEDSRRAGFGDYHPSLFDFHEPRERYSDLINALESGIKPEELREVLEEQRAAMVDYANGDRTRGGDQWMQRPRKFRGKDYDSLFWYHMTGVGG